jgi:hypothetical protein
MYNNKKKNPNQNALKRVAKPSDKPFVPNKPPLIPIGNLYDSLRDAIDTRIKWQEKQKELWVIIKKTQHNYKAEMKVIDDYIKQSTYQIDTIIGELCKHKSKHGAMKLAYDYLGNEINRLDKIIASRNELRDDVRRGTKHYITDSGETKYDYHLDDEYIKSRLIRKQKLQKWREYVHHYLD